MAVADPHERVVLEALALRTWVRVRPGEPAPPASTRAWEVFLRCERCAAWLKESGAAVGTGGPVMEARATLEWQRILSARAHLTRIAAWAAGEARQVAVLKGGVAILAGRPLDLLDIDLLAARPDALAVADFLDHHGFHQANAAAAARLGVRATPGAVQVEVHTAVPGLVGEDVWHWRPAPALRLWALQPDDHLWHVLHHATVQHPERRGRIRDLLVIADAIERCDLGALGRVRARIEADPDRALLAEALREAPLVGHPDPGPDPFELIAATNYVLAEWSLRGRREGWLADWVARAAIAEAARRTGFPSDVGGTTLAIPSARRSLTWLRRVFPAGERPLRILLRRLPEWSAWPAAAPMVRRAARAIDRAGATAA